MPVDYKNGKIYKLRECKTDKPFYIGSTTQELSARKAGHIRASKQPGKCDSPVYKHIVQIKWKFYIELIENYEAQDHADLLKREGHYIRKYKKKYDLMNKQIAGRTQTEYFQDNEEYYKEYREQYRKNNRELLRQKNEEYRENNKEKISKQKKQYRQKNKDQIQKYQKEYQQDNKEQLNARKCEHVECYCGEIVVRGALTRHKKSDKHVRQVHALFQHYNELAKQNK